MKLENIFDIEIAMIIWLNHFFSIFGHLLQWKFAQWPTKFAKVSSKGLQMQNKPSTNFQWV